MRHLCTIGDSGAVVLGRLIQPAYSQEPIKIGVMFPLTGPISAQGAPERDAIKQAFDEENNTDRRAEGRASVVRTVQAAPTPA